jgi:hypothetical protein
VAQEEARLFEHDHIGTEHLLLGLLRQGDGAAASALSSLGITLEAARERVQAGGADPGQSAPRPDRSTHIPFNRQAKRTLELALRESLQLGHDYIGTEHILLGLVREPGCRGASVLFELGAGAAAVRERVIELRPAGERPSDVAPSGRLRAMAEIGVRMDALMTRLSAVERFTGMIPDAADVDEELARLRREKDAAIDAKDFRLAEALSDAETDLLVDRDRRASEWVQLPSLAAEVARLRAEVERLRTALRSHGLNLDQAG